MLKEAQGLRDNGAWDDDSIIPVVAELRRSVRRSARQKGEIKIAEVLTLCSYGPLPVISTELTPLIKYIIP